MRQPLCLWVLCFLLVGCGKGPTVQEVKGRIEVDGKPLPHVLIQFWHADILDRPMGTAKSDDDGSYILPVNLDGSRWKPGVYRVRLLEPFGISPWRPGMPLRFPPAYGDPEASPLECALAEGENHLPNLTVPKP